MLELKGLRKTFSLYSGYTTALSDFNLTVPAGQFVTIVGSNGAGKSTLLNAVAGSVQCEEGSICLDGRYIQDRPEHRRALFVSRVFQDPAAGTASDLTIAEHMALAKKRGQWMGLRRAVTRAVVHDCREQLAILGLGLEERPHSKVKELSGGQRQALALLLALINKPRLLLLDEHTAALDPSTAKLVMNLTRSLVEKQQITTLMVTHNINHALDIGQRTLMMDSGQIVMDLAGGERDALTVEELIKKFAEKRRDAVLSDRSLLTS